MNNPFTCRLFPLTNPQIHQPPLTILCQHNTKEIMFLLHKLEKYKFNSGSRVDTHHEPNTSKISSGSVNWLTKGTSNTRMVVMSQRLLWNEPMMMNNHDGTIWWGSRVSASEYFVCIYTCICICMSLHIYIYLNLSLCDPLLSRPPCPGGLSWLCLLTQGLLTAQGKQRFLSHHTGESPALHRWVGNIHFLSCKEHTIFFLERF